MKLTKVEFLFLDKKILIFLVVSICFFLAINTANGGDCGDRICDDDEDELTCPDDCHSQPESTSPQPNHYFYETNETTISYTDPESNVTFELETSTNGRKTLRGNADKTTKNPQHIGLVIDQTEEPTTDVRIKGLNPNSQYHLYKDSYENHEAFMSDNNGEYQIAQDTTESHNLWVQEVESHTVYIRDRSDCANSSITRLNYGTWDPITRTCTLTSNLNESIEVLVNNITLDCSGRTVRGANSGYGVYVNGKIGVTIKNCEVRRFSTGIYIYWGSHFSQIIGNRLIDNANYGLHLYYSNSNTIKDNYFGNNTYGALLEHSNSNTLSNNTASYNLKSIYLYSVGLYIHSSNSNTLSNNVASYNKIGIFMDLSNSNTLLQNNMSNNLINFYLSGDTVSEFYHSIDSSNKINGKSLLYFRNLSDTTLTNLVVSTLYCVECNNVTIKDIELKDNKFGIALVGTSNSTVENVDVNNNLDGIYLFYSNSNTIKGNLARRNNNGIRLTSSSFNIVENNSALHNKPISNYNSFGKGIIIEAKCCEIGGYSSLRNALIRNTAINNSYGISVSNRGYDPLIMLIEENFISNNSVGGISLANANSNTIRNNTIISNVDGIVFSLSNSNLIKDNLLRKNTGKGIYVSWFSGGNHILNNSIAGNGNGVYLDSTNNSLVSNAIVNNSYVGVTLSDADLILIDSNEISNNNMGIYLYMSSFNTIFQNNILNNPGGGITISSADSNSIIGNNISNNGNGINSLQSSSNNVTRNSISSNTREGLTFFSWSNSNTITSNIIINNFLGIYLSNSDGNNITNNLFVNTINARDRFGANVWNVEKTEGVNIMGGRFIGGNFWHDYLGDDLDGDGLGDTSLPHTCDGEIQEGGDYVPLVSDKTYNVTLPPPKFIFTKSVVSPVVAGRNIAYYISLHNYNPEPLEGVPVMEFLEPEFTFVDSLPPPSQIITGFDNLTVLRWDIDEIGPYSSKYVSYTVRLDPNTPIGQTVSGPACTFPSGSPSPNGITCGTYNTPSCASPTTTGWVAGGRVDIPATGTGYYGYSTSTWGSTHRWSSQEMLSVIECVGANLPTGFPPVGIGDVTKQYGGNMCHSSTAHKSHQNGLDVDGRYVRIDNASSGVLTTSPDYDRVRSQQLLDLFYSCAVANGVGSPASGTNGFFVLTSDNLLTSTNYTVIHVGGHSNHFHLRLSNPYLSSIPTSPYVKDCPCNTADPENSVSAGFVGHVPDGTACDDGLPLTNPDQCKFIDSYGYSICGAQCANETTNTSAPKDPNMKAVLAPKFIQQKVVLPYVVHFENVGDIEAQDIYIVDNLDANLNLTTLKFEPSLGDYTTDINISGQRIEWSLLGINLPPNSTGEVVFSVEPNANLSSGTEIRNLASIQFESLTPILTNEVINIIDSTEPECVIDELPEETNVERLELTWSASDAVGEISEYSIFVSKDHNNFTRYITTSSSNTSFIGEHNKTYAFICIAKDTANNIETQRSVAETVTTFIFEDSDNDSIVDNYDNCPSISNANQSDIDHDGTGDLCDIQTCGNSVIEFGAQGAGYNFDEECDNGFDFNYSCEEFECNSGQLGFGCSADCQLEDFDNDGILDHLDNCLEVPNPNQTNLDAIQSSLQWASNAIASSEYTGTEWSAMQATGEPNTLDEFGNLTCGDIDTAWAPLESGELPEWLQVDFLMPMNAQGIRIAETYVGGFVYQIDLIDIQNNSHTVFTGNDTTSCASFLEVEFPLTSYPVKSAKIYTQVNDWEEIDAVELQGSIGDGVGDACDVQTCGNNIVEAPGEGDGYYANEECDDGNIINNDGCSSTCTIEVRDTEPPTIENDIYSNITNNPQVTLSGFITDPEPSSGIRSFQVNGENVILDNNTFSYVYNLVEGTNLIEEIAIDNGNNNVTVYKEILLDTGVPSSNVSTSDLDNDNFTDVIAIHANDEPLEAATIASEVKEIRYSINNGPLQIVNGNNANIQIPQFTNLITIEYYSIDNAGNIESAQQLTLYVDSCPSQRGKYFGCPVADKNNVELHVIDRPRVFCGGAGSCEVPLEGSFVKVFDRRNQQFISSYGSNPNGIQFPTIFESAIGRVSACTTNSSGTCIAPELEKGTLLVIIKYYDITTNKTVYTGLPKGLEDFVDTDNDGITDLATKNFQIIKTINQDGSMDYKGGAKTIIIGSALEVIHPLYVIWDEELTNYPFIFTSQEEWTVDVCLYVPEGYQIVGDNCTQEFVQNQTKELIFTVRDIGSPEPNFMVNLNTNHEGKQKINRIEIPGQRTWTMESSKLKLAKKEIFIISLIAVVVVGMITIFAIRIKRRKLQKSAV